MTFGPVIVGVGAVTQHLDEPDDGHEALELMIAASLEAADDAGCPEILRQIDRILIPRGTWGYSDPGRLIGDRLGSPGAWTSLVAAGTPQQTLLNDAYRAIKSGAAEVVLVVGGEAARRAALARRAGIELTDTIQIDAVPGELRLPQGEIVSPAEIEAGVYTPVLDYALIDSALRFAEGQSIEGHRDDIAELWAEFSRVASECPSAADRVVHDRRWLREPSADNPMMAFPYNKSHCAQMNVDQAAAILICAHSAATRLGISADRWIHPLVALESSAAVAVPRRRDIYRWPAMNALGKAAEQHLGVPLASIGLVEVYSCFPAAVRVQQRELGLRFDGVPTITGGEPFGGGPWNNFVLQATVAMIERLRSIRGSIGVVTTVSGFLHKPGLAAYSTSPGERPLLVDDLAEVAVAATATVDVVTGYAGPATIAAITVSSDRAGALTTIVIADTSDGLRCVAKSDDPAVAVAAMSVELIGTTITVTGTSFTR